MQTPAVPYLDGPQYHPAPVPPPPPPPPAPPPAVIPPTLVSATLATIATDGHDHWINGNGIPAAGVLQQNVGNIQVSQQIDYRSGDTATLYAVNHDGSPVFKMPAGPQDVDPAHNVSSANANRGAVAEGVAFVSDTTGHTTHQELLSEGYKFNWSIDLNPGSGVSSLNLTESYDPAHATGSSPIVFIAADNMYIAQGTILVNDNAGNPYVTENFTNLSFWKSLIDTDPNTPGIQPGTIDAAGDYVFETQVVNPQGQVISDFSAHVLLV